VYWVDPKLKEHGMQLCAKLHGFYVAETSDRFFGQLEAALAILDRSGPPKRLSGEVMALQARRAIENKQWTRVETLMSDATGEVVSWIAARQNGAPDSADEQARQHDAAQNESEPICRLAATIAHYGGDDWPIRQALSRLLEASYGRQSFGTFSDPNASYPVVLLAFTWGIVRALRRGWRDAVTTLRSVGSGTQHAELVFPPGSNRHLSPFREPTFASYYKDSPLEHWGNRVSNAVYSYCREWIARRNEFDDFYDRLDTIVAIRSARIGEWWIPRCFVARDIGGRFSRYSEIFEGWLLGAVTQNEDWAQEAFADIGRTPDTILSELRKVAAEEQSTWRP
jgi:hypothetical protein